MTPKLAIEHVSKSYNTVRALDDVSLCVAPGSVFGLLGRNGAGKSTTLGCALGLVRKDCGAVWFDGRPLAPATFHDIAYVPEAPALDDWMTGAQYIQFHRRIYRHFDVLRARELAGMLNVPLDSRIGRLSKGQKAALTIVLAFAQRASLLVLDEPGCGLDPYAQRLLLDFIIQEAADGRTIVFSSHQIGQIERAAESVAILERGRMILHGDIDELATMHKIIEAVFVQAPAIEHLRKNPNIAVVETAGPLLRLRARGDIEGIGRDLQALGAQSIRSIDQSLEDIFLAAVSPSTPEGR